MIERHLRRVNPTWAGWRLRSAVQEAFDSYARYWFESLRLPRLGKRTVANGHRGRRLPVRAGRRSTQGKGVILALPHLGGWEWAGRWLADQRPPSHRGGGADRTARAVRMVRRPALQAGDERSCRSAPRPARDPAGARAQRDRVPAVRPRHRWRRASRSSSSASAPRCRPGRRRSGSEPERPILPIAVYFTHRQRSPRRRAPAGARRPARQAPRRRRPGHPVPRRRARAPDPPSPRAVAPVPAELAERPRLRRLTW